LQCGHVVGLGRGKEHPVDPGAEQPAKQASPAEPECREDRFEREALICEGLFTGVERAQHVDKNDLPIDVVRQMREKWLHDNPLVGLETRLHQGGEAARARSPPKGERHGAKP